MLASVGPFIRIDSKASLFVTRLLVALFACLHLLQSLHRSVNLDSYHICYIDITVLILLFIIVFVIRNIYKKRSPSALAALQGALHLNTKYIILSLNLSNNLSTIMLSVKRPICRKSKMCNSKESKSEIYQKSES